ncbi:MAG TPA: LLM class F420-dependent oxidoreductase [Pseudonocardiaceae bacterium]|nr:LLM class F420-dependent oxidoreductase [Pseudonocardiaceae bacterium]
MMTFGIHTILTDRMIHPAKLGPALEERGFGTLFLAEHSHIPVRAEANHAATGGGVPPIYRRVQDPFVALGVVSSVTEKLLLGTGTSLPIQRDPIQTAKEVATLDFLSGGRLVFGVGAGWVREEISNHGTDPKTRGALLDERLAAMIEIWTNDEAEYHGRYVDFDPIFAWPKPVRQPHPPIYVGGDSPHAIARAKRFGGWMPRAATTPEDVAAQVGLVGPEVPVIANGVRPQPELVAAYRAAGATGINFHLPELATDDALRTLDEFAALLSS